MLILECDHERLSRDSLQFGRWLNAKLVNVLPDDEVIFVQTKTEQQLCAALGELAGKLFEIIVVVGHSNVSSIKLTGDKFVSWSATAAWLEPFQPKKLVLVACDGARSLPASTLFSGIRSLVELFGSPAKINMEEANSVFLLILLLLGGKGITAEYERLLVGLNTLLTGGIIFRRTRKDCTKKKSRPYEKDNFLEESIGLLQPHIRKLSRELLRHISQS